MLLEFLKTMKFYNSIFLYSLHAIIWDKHIMDIDCLLNTTFFEFLRGFMSILNYIIPN